MARGVSGATTPLVRRVVPRESPRGPGPALVPITEGRSAMDSLARPYLATSELVLVSYCATSLSTNQFSAVVLSFHQTCGVEF